MIGNHDLSIWFLTPEDDVAPILALELKSLFQEGGDALVS
jgi:hypothetical protein